MGRSDGESVGSRGEPPAPRQGKADARLSAILRVIPDVVLVIDENGRYLDVHTGDESLLVRPSSELIGRTLSDVLPADLAQTALESVRACLQTKAVTVSEYALAVGQGHRWFEIRMAPLTTDGMDRPAVLGIARDITARREGEAAAQRQTERLLRYQAALFDLARLTDADLPSALRKITETSAEAMGVERASIWNVRQDKTGIECVDLFMKGAQRHESGLVLEAANFPSYFHALTHDPNIAADDALTDPRTSEFGDGYLRPLGITSMLDAPVIRNGRVEAIVCHEHVGPKKSWTLEERNFVMSIAELVSLRIENADRTAAADALRETETRFRHLAEHFGEVFWMTDAGKTTVVYVSPGYERVWGRSVASLHASPSDWLASIHPEDRDRVQTASLSRQVSGQYNEEYRIVRPDGQVRWIWDRAFPVKEPSGDVRRIAGIAMDVTERKQLEDKLRQAAKLEAVGRLAGGIAHDFNNLLTVINTSTDLLGRQMLDRPELLELLGEVADAGRRAATLTSQLLAYSRREMVRPAIVDLNGVVSETERLLRRLIGEDVVLTTDLGSHMRPVEIDRSHLEQLIVNLAVNGRDAMPRGGALTIRTRTVTVTEPRPGDVPPGCWIRLDVIDSGHGISAEAMPHIFEPFFTTKGVGKGTGLGLASVYGAVQQAGGHISVESQPGAGCTFTIHLPPAKDVRAPEPAQATLRPQGGRAVIVVVEDEPSVRRTLARILEPRGYDVLLATGASESLGFITDRDGSVDLVVTDVVMPGQSGPDLAREIGKRWPKIRILFMSGYTADTIIRHGVESNTAAFIQKPFSPDELLAKVRDVLSLATPPLL